MDQWDDIINKSFFDDTSVKNRILDMLVDPVNKFNNLKKQFLALTNTQSNYQRKQQLLSDMLYISNSFDQAAFVALYAIGKTYESAVRKISGFRDTPLNKLIEICCQAVDDQGDLLRKTLIVLMSQSKTPIEKWEEIKDKYSKNHIMYKISESLIKKLSP
jgi:hypothetical protein